MKAQEAWKGTTRVTPTEAENEAVETLLGLLWVRILHEQVMGRFSLSLTQFWSKHVRTKEYPFAEVPWPTVTVEQVRRDDLFLCFVERVAGEGYRIEYSHVSLSHEECSASWFLGGEVR